jgi:hypothetical protein
MTYRDVELDVKRPFAQTLESLFRQRLATRITLRRMTDSGVPSTPETRDALIPLTSLWLDTLVLRPDREISTFPQPIFINTGEEGQNNDSEEYRGRRRRRA